MIRKVHFVQLTLLMLLLFVLFQITSISITFDKFRDSAGEGTIDRNVINMKLDSLADTLLITGKKSDAASYVEQQLIYLKRSYRVEESLLPLTEDDLRNVKVIILASDRITGAYDLQSVQKYMRMGINIIMAVLPAGELSGDWKSFLGIKELGRSYKQEGIIVFTGFFLGGKQEYKTLRVDTTYIKVASTCKTYIAGMLKEEGKVIYENEKMNDIIWRNVYEGSQIYTVNGSFFHNNDSMGILTAIFTQMYQDFIYPVINAKALLVNNAPYLSKENDNEMQKRYARSSNRLFEDILLPNIIAISLSSNNVPTFFAVDSLDKKVVDKSEINPSVLSFTREELGRIGGEIGISAFDRQDTRAEKKVTNATRLFISELGDYHVKSMNMKHYDKGFRTTLVTAVDNITNLSSLVSGLDEGMSFSFYNDSTVNIPVITKGFSFTDEELFTLHSATTALGVITHEIDINDIIYPESEDDDWSKAYSDLTSMINTYWKEYKVFDSMNITNTGKRVFRFLTMKPETKMKDNILYITIEGFDTEAYFILRSEKHITDIKNGKYRKIEEGAYLIYASSEKLEIALND